MTQTLAEKLVREISQIIFEHLVQTDELTREDIDPVAWALLESATGAASAHLLRSLADEMSDYDDHAKLIGLADQMGESR